MPPYNIDYFSVQVSKLKVVTESEEKNCMKAPFGKHKIFKSYCL